MNAPAVTGLYLAAVLLLAVAGVGKCWQPGDTAIAMRIAGVPLVAGGRGRLGVRVASAVEVGLALAALTLSGPVPPVAVAGSYVCFAAFVATARHKGWPLASCGCLGRADTPPSLPHVAVNVVGAGVALRWATCHAAALPTLVEHQSGHGVVLLAVSVALLGVTLVVLTAPPTGPRSPQRHKALP